MNIRNKIFEGHVLEVLKTFPDQCVDMVVTSPPYWGLRDYGIDPVIWDGGKDCEHTFEIEKLTAGYTTRERWQHKVHGDGRPSDYGNVQKKRESRINKQPQLIVKHGFCSKCGAWKGCLGLEPDFRLYIKHLCDIFDEIQRVLKDSGTIWVNLGDTYASKPKGNKEVSGLQSKNYGIGKDVPMKKNIIWDIPSKSLVGIPERFKIEMVDNRGWIHRNTIIWHKSNPMPSSAKDRFTVDFEYLYFFSKKKKYYFEQQFESAYAKPWSTESRKGGVQLDNNPRANPKEDYSKRNKRCVWTIPTKPYAEAHFATYPPDLIKTPIKAGCQKGGILLDPFMGSGTTAIVAKKLGRDFCGIELNPEYIELTWKRLGIYKNNKGIETYIKKCDE